MTGYRAPLRDMQFVLHEVLPGEWPDLACECGRPAAEDCNAVLSAAARFSEDVLHPISRAGDEQGCCLAAGAVQTPPGYRDAYAAFVSGGWPALACGAAFGGQGLPHVLRVLVDEMLCASNLSFASYVLLLHGAYRTLVSHAAAELQQRYLPPLAAGRWMATMCLTEAQAGSDLGLIRTRATPDERGGYLISGSKIFVSAGEHDLAENIVHLVLARLPDAEPGTRGISLFLVPKWLPDAHGTPASRNRVSCVRLEDKMGQKAAATCGLEFDGATGWLVGAPHRGLAAMFSMMNTVRLSAATQGLGIAAAAYQRSVDYARERRQGQFIAAGRMTDDADPIVVHPDVRRTLLTQRCWVEGMRALALWIAQALDLAERHSDSAVRTTNDEFVALMTPVAKALCTDLGSQCADLAIQVFGGHGYIRDHGVEQLLRDVRVARIYDGTNGIQALDLVRRKIAAGLAPRLFEPLESFLQDHGADPELLDFTGPLAEALARLRSTTDWVTRTARHDPACGAGAATEYLRQFGLVALAFCWARMAKAASSRLDGADADFYRAKLATGRFFMRRLLPREQSLAQSILSGGTALQEFDGDWY